MFPPPHSSVHIVLYIGQWQWGGVHFIHHVDVCLFTGRTPGFILKNWILSIDIIPQKNVPLLVAHSMMLKIQYQGPNGYRYSSLVWPSLIP